MTIEEQQLVVFELADAPYIVDIRSVREIIRHEPIRTVPNAPEAVDGVINLRGLVVPIVDLRRCLGLPMRSPTNSTRIIVVDIPGAVAGFIVDAVTEVLRMPSSAIKPAPALAVTSRSNSVAGVAMVDERLMMVIDVERLISSEALRAVDEGAPNTAPAEPVAVVGEVTRDAADTPPDGPSLAGLDIELLEATFAAVKPRAAELVEYFYDRLFTLYPAVVPMFANADMQEQQGKLLSALALVVASLRQPEALVPALQRLGAKHVEYGAQPAHYDAVGAVLLDSLAYIAGDQWSAEAAQAWADAFGVVAGVMIEAAEAAVAQAA